MAQLFPQTRRHVSTVAHADAGTADHRVQIVAQHELGQRAPQGEDRTARAPSGVDARASQLDHPGAQRAQASQIELGFAVEPADAPGGGRRENAVRADHRSWIGIEADGAHQQMFAVRIEQVDVVPGGRSGRHHEARPHLLSKHEVSQLLSLSNIIVIASPNHFETRVGVGVCVGARRARVK